MFVIIYISTSHLPISLPMLLLIQKIIIFNKIIVTEQLIVIQLILELNNDIII